MTSTEQDQDITIQIAKDFKGINVSLPRLRRLVKTVCCRRVAKYEISIAIVDDTQIRKLNSRFLNRKATTDCLSFDLSDDEEKSKVSNRKLRVLELVVNGEMAVKQANLRGHSSEAELALYITHSLLHNLGFNDSTRGQARKMHDTEDKILQEFGYGLVYNKSKQISNIE